MNDSTLVFKRDHTFIQKLAASKIFWIIFVLLGFGYPLYKSVNRTLPEPLPVLYQVPDFELTNGFNKKLQMENAELKKQVLSLNQTVSNLQ